LRRRFSAYRDHVLTQSDADSLIAMPKRYEGPPGIRVMPGTSEIYDVVGATGLVVPEERFILDLARGRRKSIKLKFQTRARKIVILVRLDLNSAPHTNPDGSKVDGSHLHIFREGFGDRWAQSIDPKRFSDPSDLTTSFREFCGFCRIANLPAIQESLL
jgi:hypothetical protein